MTTAPPQTALRTRPEPGPERGRVYGGETAVQRSERRRAKVLAAGLVLFGTTGYAATRVERICALAQVSTRHFYELFASKEAAFIAVYEHLVRGSYEGVTASVAVTDGLPYDKRIARAFDAYLHPLFSDARAARIVFVEIAGISPAIEERRNAYRELLIEVVEREAGAALAQGEIAARDFRFALLSLVGAATVTVNDWVTRADGRTPEQLREQLSALAHHLLSG